ncbi:uncharacterized protein haspin [Nematolebias whitei]|uniref:uncharacterized protein haspin n=1 Tax=Nematolebias whitei TaxID=451745 RepID=UPI00189ADF37|nr:uncharacterized protein haspin [Nematolebias whitei]
MGLKEEKPSSVCTFPQETERPELLCHNGLLASAGRYVTRRKCTASTNPPKARIVTLNSSDDFTPGRIVPSRRLQPSRGRRNQPAFGVSSAESSVIFVGASSFTNAHVREISLNDSGNPNLGPCSRKPIFCSTPSAASFAKRGPSKPFALQGQITSSSVSASCVSNTFQEDLNSPQQPFSPPLSASPSEQDGRLPRNKEQPPDLFIESKGGSCSEGDTNLSGDSKAQYDVELASRDLFSSDSESSSRFVSAAGGLEWLIEALKQKCLSQRCEVQLERLSFLPVTQLCACDDHTNVGQLSESDNNENSASSKIDTKNGRSTRSKAASGNKVEKLHKPICRVEKSCLGSKENRRGSVFPQQTGTARKACVSGISVSRWKNKGVDGGTLRSRAAKKAAPCELISVQHIQPMDLGTTINFFTPVRAIQLSTLSLLADSPSTHTWSRLKASRSVHRKGLVQITPKSPFIRCSARSLGLADVSLELFATPLRSMLPRHLRSQLMSQHSVPLCEDADLSDAEKVYAECGQQHPLPWEECILPHRMKRCVKIGEGTFGEVFSTTNSSGDTVALKIHQDLHWGNVLVKTTKQKMESFLLNGTAHSVETKGVLVRLIDYSLSRVEIDDLTVSCDISNDEELFMGQGDYQFEIYRLMREENGNNWSTYHPRTNVLWLHYLCSKLLSMKYRSLKRRAFKTVHEELTCFHGDILRCSSATEALQTCSLFQQH